MRENLMKAALGDVFRVDRRQFFRLGALAALAGVAPNVFAKLDPKKSPSHTKKGERDLRFYHTHTGESLRVVYWENGKYLSESLTEVNHLLRDFRTDEVKPITPALLDLLHRVQKGLGTREPFHVISAYRSPTTNEMLHKNTSGVANHSLHMDGLAIDVRVPGRDLRQLQKAALAQKAGGVGYYPSSQFVHLDVGRVRHW
jgi:uncharacterized protein YcbK (DUF882 family)